MPKPWANLTQEERIAKLHAYRQSKIDSYLAEHGAAPLCACGCGGSVNFDKRGKPCKYIAYHHGEVMAKVTEARLGDTIEIEQFRAAVKKVKMAKGWTWEELAWKAGMAPGNLSAVMFKKNRKCVTKAWARDFFARIAGQPMPITDYQKERLRRFEIAERSIDASYHGGTDS